MPMKRTQPLLARARSRRFQLTAALATTVAALSVGLPGTASASNKQIAIIQDGNALNADPAGTIARFRELGATTIRVLVLWKDFAPDPNSRRAPAHFAAGNPGAYPAANWSTLDTIVTTARSEGMTVDLDPTGPPPDWAQGRGVSSYVIKHGFADKVNAGAYGSFVHALAQRYDGAFKPKGASRALPKVAFWSLWNEPNFGQDLGPQAVGATPKFDGFDVAAGYYRNLVRDGYRALKSNGRLRGAKILVGELAGQGRSFHKTRKFPQGLPGDYAITWPVSFIQTLYCVNGRYQRLTGTAARMAGCPLNLRAARSFRRNNPGLFETSGISSHPYASTFAPNRTKGIPSLAIVLPVINRLETEMRRVAGHYGDHRGFPIYSTEYGFVTSPPQPRGHRYPSPFTAATYLNEAEYLSYRNRSVASYAQYLLDDPPNLLSRHVGLFSSGLLTDKDRPKPAFNAYRLPLWVPHTSVRRNTRTEVWGGARPAIFGVAATHRFQRVAIQLQANGRGAYKTIATVTASRANGYFDAHVKLSSSGNLRLRYTYPSTERFLPLGVAGTSIVSRTVKVRVH